MIRDAVPFLLEYCTHHHAEASLKYLKVVYQVSICCREAYTFMSDNASNVFSLLKLVAQSGSTQRMIDTHTSSVAGRSNAEGRRLPPFAFKTLQGTQHALQCLTESPLYNIIPQSYLDKMVPCATGWSNDSQTSDQPDVAGRDVIKLKF